MINAVTDIQEDTTVEIVINVQPLGDEDVEIRPHALSVHSYKTPTFCNFCGEMLFGMFKQVKLVVKPGIAREYVSCKVIFRYLFNTKHISSRTS